MPDLVGLKQSEAEKILKDYDVTINKTVFKELLFQKVNILF